MSAQPALNFNPLRDDYPPHNGTPTSIKAAEFIKPYTPSMKATILLSLILCPATREELADKLTMKLQTVCGRVSELKQAGYVTELDTKEGSSGCDVTVLTATTEGERYMQAIQAGVRG